MKDKSDGPQFLQKTTKGRADEEPQPKVDLTSLTPPGAATSPRETAADKMGIIHAAQAAAARVEDRADEPDPDAEDEDRTPKHDDEYLDAVASRIANQFQGGEQLQTDEQKKLIEKRLEERGLDLNISQMYEQSEFRQLVPIRPGEFEAEFRTITPEEDVKIKEMMSGEDENASIRYLQDKYAVVGLVCALRAINGRLLPEHFTHAGGWSQKGYNEKAKIIFRMPTPAVWSLMVHNMWFDERCRKVFKMEDLKNG